MNVNAVIIVVVNSLVTVKIGMNTSITGLGAVANLVILQDEQLHDMTMVTLTDPILVPAASEIMRKKGYTTVTFNFNACHKILCFIPSKVSLIGQRHIQKYQAWVQTRYFRYEIIRRPSFAAPSRTVAIYSTSS